MIKRLYYALFAFTPILLVFTAYAGCYFSLGQAQQSVFAETWRRFPDKQIAWVFVPAARIESQITGANVKAAYLDSTCPAGLRSYRAHESEFGSDIEF
jgi:hypothetical protein